MGYLAAINQLNENPEWYNALTQNSTSKDRGHTKLYNPYDEFDLRMITNKHIDEIAYENKVTLTNQPFSDLRGLSLISEMAQKADRDPDFSERIRKMVYKLEGRTSIIP